MNEVKIYFWLRHDATAVRATKTASSKPKTSESKEAPSDGSKDRWEKVILGGTIRHLASGYLENAAVDVSVLEKYETNKGDISFFGYSLQPSQPFHSEAAAVRFKDQDVNKEFSTWRNNGYAVLVEMKITVT